MLLYTVHLTVCGRMKRVKCTYTMKCTMITPFPRAGEFAPGKEDGKKTRETQKEQRERLRKLKDQGRTEDFVIEETERCSIVSTWAQ